ncbi:hypothetical protein J3F82_001793 [Coemansia sp. RSA 637]|nr:hypothetical protein J3F82_001793 [Coemansia sp. RSA 637]
MKFDALPDDVLLPIFEAAIPAAPNIICLKRSIYQLSITQRLRHLLLPRIYGHAFISSVFNRKQEQTNDGLYMSFVRSNLELAIATSNVLPFRVLHLETEYTGQRGDCLHGLIDALKGYQKHLHNVNELVMWIDYDKLSKLQIPASENAPDYASVTAKRVARLLPHVKRVTIREKSNERSTERFYGELVNAYIDQLETIASASKLKLPTTRAFDQLTCLKVDVELCGTYVPRVCPNTIQHLTLENLLPKSTWRVFGFEDVPTTMEASSLVSLDIKYHDYSPDEDLFDYEAAKQCKMHFPRLKSLKLCIRSAKVPLLDSAVFPQQMDYITIEASPLSTLMLAGIEFPKTKFPSLVVFEGDNAPLQDLFKATDNFFMRSTECLKARLLIPFTSSIITPGMIQCTMFTILHLRSNVCINVILEVVTRMQNLKELAISRINVRRFKGNISIPKPSSMRILKPLHMRMKNLSIWANYFDNASEGVKAIVKYLAVRIPSLTQLYARTMKISDLEDFRKEYEGLYPHLSTISFER